jgi:hypoxanthine phosphoribosyltransferase
MLKEFTIPCGLKVDECNHYPKCNKKKEKYNVEYDRKLLEFIFCKDMIEKNKSCKKKYVPSKKKKTLKRFISIF